MGDTIRFLQIQKTINYKDLIAKKSISPNNFKSIKIKNKNTDRLIDIIDNQNVIKGKEIGSNAYIKQSPRFFMRTQAISDDYFILTFNKDSFVPIIPQEFDDAYANQKDKLVSKGSLFYVKGGDVGAIGIAEKDYDSIFSSHILKLNIEDEDLRYYIFAILKNDFGKAQITNLPVGSIEGLDTFNMDYFNNIIVPFPNKDRKEIMQYVSLLVKAIIRREQEIQSKYGKISELISNELSENTKSQKFTYGLPQYSDIKSENRFDTGLYSEGYKHMIFSIHNYNKGFSTLDSMGYKIKRGQNLQTSNVGNSIYLDTEASNFYKLILSKNITEYMTVSKFVYLGNPNKLKKVNKGQILFTCRGDMGRCLIFCYDNVNTITNIDNVMLTNSKTSLQENIFTGLFLNYLKRKGFIDEIAIGGSGADSFTKYHFDKIIIPSFSKTKQEEIAEYYYSEKNLDFSALYVGTFEDRDKKIVKESGIAQLDQQIKKLNEKLDDIVNKVVEDREISIDLSFLS